MLALRGKDRKEKRTFSGTVLGKPAEEGESPVHEKRKRTAGSGVARDTRNPA